MLLVRMLLLASGACSTPGATGAQRRTTAPVRLAAPKVLQEWQEIKWVHMSFWS